VHFAVVEKSKQQQNARASTCQAVPKLHGKLCL